MRRRYLTAAAVLLCSMFMYGCVASEGDVGFIYTRQKDIETNLKKAEKDIEWLKAEVSNEDANLEIKEQIYELQNKMLELEQVVGAVHSGVETMKTDILKSSNDAGRRGAETVAAGNGDAALMKRIGELEARVSQLEQGTEKPLAAPTPPAQPASEPETAGEKPEPPRPEASAEETEPVKSETAAPEPAEPQTATQSQAPAEEPAPVEPETPAPETSAQTPAASETAQPRVPAEEPEPSEPESPAPETPARKPAEPEDASRGTGAYYDLGKKKLAEGEYGDARVLFRKYADANPVAPDAPEAVFLIADSYFMEKLYEEAILEYQNLIDIYPDSPRVTTSQLKQGIALLEIEKPNEAALFFESLIESHPRSPEADEARKYLKNIKAPKAAE